MANAFLSGYGKRKYRGFVANDAVKSNWAKLIVGYDGAGTDADGKVYNLDCRSDFNDFALARFAAGSNTRQKEWKEKHTADTSADKWFKPTESYSSVLTGDAAAAQAVVNVNDASGFAANDWIVITRDDGTDEFLEISSIATNALTMATNLANAYTTADNAKVMLGYYVYYDDADDTTDYQDGVNTFTFFDDFSAALDGAKWDEGGAGSLTVTGGELLITNSYYAYSVATFTGGYAIRAKMKFGSDAVGAFWVAFADAGNSSSNINLDYSNHNSGQTYFRLNSGDGTDYHVQDSANTRDTSYHVHDIMRTGSADYFSVDGEANKTGNYPTNAARYLQLYAFTADATFNFVFVRTYPDITGSGFGAEEEQINTEVAATLLTATSEILVAALALDMKPVASLLTADGAVLEPAFAIDRIFTSSLLTADAAMLVHVIGIGTTVEATLLTATTELLVHTITTTKNPNIAASLLTADGAMLVPEMVLDRIFTASLITADGALLTPTLALDRKIAASLLAATGEMLIPTLVLDRKVEVSLLTANGAILTPTFVLDRKFVASLLTANAAILTPTFSLGVVITATLMTGEAVMLIPSIDIEGKPFIGIAYNIKQIEGHGYMVKKIEGVGYNVKKIAGIKGG